MDSSERGKQKRLVRLYYELGRAKWALFGVGPVLVLASAAAVFAHHPTATGGFGAASFAVGAVMLWYGRDPERAVLPGLIAGLFPLVLAACSSGMNGGWVMFARRFVHRFARLAGSSPALRSRALPRSAAPAHCSCFVRLLLPC